MKKITLTFVTALLFIAVCTVQAQDKDAMMKAWKEYATPGDVHKMMAKDNGTWSADITMWMDPTAPAQKSKGTCTNSMILGGRYQKSVHKATMMGMPFEGIGILGYDNNKKVFVSSWVDNMGTGVMYMEGPWDDATKSITLKGKCVDPMTGKDMEMRQVMTIIDDKHQKLEMYYTTDGKEMKNMEINFTKQAAKK